MCHSVGVVVCGASNVSQWDDLDVTVGLIVEPEQGGYVTMGTGIPSVLYVLLKAPVLIRLAQIWLDVRAPKSTRGDKITITKRTVLVRVCLCLGGCPVDVLLSASSYSLHMRPRLASWSSQYW